MTDMPLLAYQAAPVLRLSPIKGETPAIITLPKADLNGGRAADGRARAPRQLPGVRADGIAAQCRAGYSGPPTGSTGRRQAAAPHRRRTRSTKSTSTPRCPTVSIVTTRRTINLSSNAQSMRADRLVTRTSSERRRSIWSTWFAHRAYCRCPSTSASVFPL